MRYKFGKSNYEHIEQRDRKLQDYSDQLESIEKFLNQKYENSFSIQSRISLQPTTLKTAEENKVGIEYKEPLDYRVDGCLYRGLEPSPFFDPLVMKLICSGSSFEEARQKSVIKLRELTLSGVETNRISTSRLSPIFLFFFFFSVSLFLEIFENFTSF